MPPRADLGSPLSSSSLWEAFLRTAAAHPHGIALRSGPEWFTFREVRTLAVRFGDALRARYGVGRGDLVALSLRNSPEWIMALLGVARIGAAVVPIEGWDLGELQSLLTSHAITAAVCDHERLFRYVAILNRSEPTTLGGVVLCRSFITGVVPFVDHWRSMTAPSWSGSETRSVEEVAASLLDEAQPKDVGEMVMPAAALPHPLVRPAPTLSSSARQTHQYQQHEEGGEQMQHHEESEQEQEMHVHLDDLAFALPVAAGPYRGSSLVKLTHRDCLLAVAGLDLEGEERGECSTLFCPVPLRTLLSGGTIIIPKSKPASNDNIMGASTLHTSTLTSTMAAIADTAATPAASASSSPATITHKKKKLQTKPPDAKPLPTAILKSNAKRKNSSGTARAIQIIKKYDQHLKQVHEASQDFAPVSAKLESFNVDLNPLLIDWSSSWVQPMQVPLLALFGSNLSSTAKAKEQQRRQARAGTLPGEPVMTIADTQQNAVNRVGDLLAGTSTDMIGAIPAIPSRVMMDWDTTYSVATAGALMKSDECGSRRLALADPVGCDTGFVEFANTCRKALASHPSVSAVLMFFDKAAKAEMAAQSPTGPISALWGAVVFKEGRENTSLPSAMELLDLCPQPDPDDPQSSKYILHGLVRWRQRGSLVRAGQAYQSRL